VSEAERVKKLEALYARIRRDPGYRNGKMSDIFVPGWGVLKNSPVVLVGEAPGINEEKLGVPFIGASGRNLDSLLKVSGLSREDLFITNVIKYRPVTPEGKNRSPSVLEIRKALPYLLEELAILSPNLAVCLGLCPTRALIGGNPVMEKANGTIHCRSGIHMMVTYHPSPFNFMIAKKREAMMQAFKLLGEYLSKQHGVPQVF
jgi:uracil-DNA glycosylase